MALDHPLLTTQVPITKAEARFELGDRVHAVGSCFAEHLAEKLRRYLFPVVLNPYGVMYNPISLARAIEPGWSEPELFLHDGLWRSLRHHSSLAWTSREQSLHLLANAERYKQHALKTSRWLVLTLGTGYAFTLATGGEVVANCQRLPNSLFQRRLLDLQECRDALEPPLHNWLQEDEARQVVLTVSPVRYLRDGLVENSRGKALLHLLCQALETAHQRISYFPAFEIVCDELRSYRYFESDLVQPNALAVDIVWNRFQKAYFQEEDLSTLTLMEKLVRAFEHRSGPLTDSRALGRKSLQRLEQLRTKAPNLDLNIWEERFRAMLEDPIKG